MRTSRRTWWGMLVAGAAIAVAASGCDTPQQVPWATYDQQLQVRIDSAAAAGDCATLQALLAAAKATSDAHEKASGYDNEALESYIEAAQHRAGCS